MSREREALVRTRARARVRIEMRTEALMPGFSSQFGSLWDSPLPVLLARECGSAQALLAAGESGLLVDTPLVLLLSIPGLNVVWSSTLPLTGQENRGRRTRTRDEEAQVTA